MATWKDGAAYAPVERPDGFATPVAEPLPSGAPYRAETPGPVAHPQGFEPLPPQQPLTEIGQARTASRDPRDAFEVASSLVTAGPDAPVSGPRDPRTPFPTAAPSPLDTAPPPPTGLPLPPTHAPFPPTHAPYPSAPPTGAPSAPQPSTDLVPRRTVPSGELAAYPPPQMPVRRAEPGQHYPAPPQHHPSTQHYPAQPQYYPPLAQQPAHVPDSHRQLALVSGILCLVGFFATGTAGFMLLVAGLLGLRTRVLTKALGSIALSGGATALVLQLLLSPYDWRMFSGFWGLIALGCGIGFLIYSRKGR
ncbi:MAG: hypothetical protein Q4G35_08865 [Propionibacteriaceae bacterium]|nr:hypothetical protein [Propionibacteriaceae bacterium]